MTTSETSSRYMRDLDVAAHFQCGRSTVWRWVKQGLLPEPVRIGGATRWLRADIEAAFNKAA